jgi:hypothetical protein
MENPQQTLLPGAYGKSNSAEKIETEPLTRIPEPPESYIEFKCLIYGLDDEERQHALRGLYKKNPEWKREIGGYMIKLLNIKNHNVSWAEMALAEDHLTFQGSGIPPVEKIEIRQSDGKKHGQSQWMLIIDFDYWRQEGEPKRRKIYIPLDPESQRYDKIKR